MTAKRFKTILIKDDKTTACGINLPFTPKEVFGKARAPVTVTINGFMFRTTTFTMNGVHWIPVNKENREGAGIAAGDRIIVEMALDTEPRVVTPPGELASLLKKSKRAGAAWDKLSYTHQKEYARWIGEAKRPETRLKRIKETIARLSE